MPPQGPTDQGATGEHHYQIPSFGMRLVSEYTGLDFERIYALDYIKYLAWRRDAYIYALERTEDGQAYLDDAWRLEQTEPDRAALRRRLKGGNRE